MSPWALVTVPKRRFLAQERSHHDVTASSPLSLGPKRAFPPKSENQPRSTPKSDWGWRGPGAGLVRAWCGPGAGLVRAWCGLVLVNPVVPVNPVVGQDCPSQSCRHGRIALMHHQQLGLGAVLLSRLQARRLCSEQRAGRLRRASRSSEWKARSCPASSCHSSSCCWEDGRIGILCGGRGAWRGRARDSPVRPDIARPHCAVAAACSLSVICEI